MKIKISFIIALVCSLYAQENLLDEISITATKIKTPSKQVSQSIGIIDKKEIRNLPKQNVTELFQKIPGVLAISKNGGYDTRIFIRGSGVKARYGVRDIMVLRDGVPITDPDSFTRFDFIDTQDIEQVEITKGPGSIYSSGSAGGTIQILSKSVFEEQQNRVRVGIGSFGAYQANIRVGGEIDENNYLSITATDKRSKNDWRYQNRFDSKQISIKHGHIFSDDSTLESELSYSIANLELPTSLTKSEFDRYGSTGEVKKETSDEWQNKGRYSKIVFLNSRYEKELDGFTFKPQIYYNHWSHFHPVPFMINDSSDNNVFGTDIQLEIPHTLDSNKATLLVGITARANISLGEKKYKYKDLQYALLTAPYPHIGIEKSLSDKKGDLAETSDSKTYLYGFYLQEMMNYTKNLSFDMMFRLDKADININGNEIYAANYSTKTYKTGAGIYSINRDLNLLSYRLGTSYALNKTSNLYATIGYSDQIPTESEFKSNVLYDGSDPLPKLKVSKSTNYEIGYKHRDNKIFVDITTYYTAIKDDITQVIDSSKKSYYQNAGKVEKKGVEIQTEYTFLTSAKIGASYTYSRYKYKELLEYQYSAPAVDYSGNYLPYVPKNQYTLYASYGKKRGVQASVESVTWGSYYTDNSNSAKYEGFKYVTNISIGYKTKQQQLKLYVNNLFDKHYAVATSGDKDEILYTPAAPRTIMLSYTYRF